MHAQARIARVQGRYCTGTDFDGAGDALPIVGDEAQVCARFVAQPSLSTAPAPSPLPPPPSPTMQPTSSLILAPIPGCAFGSEWQDADLEGAVLRDVWLSMAAQLLSVVLILLDQGVALLHACVAHCRVLGRRDAIAKRSSGSRWGGAGAPSLFDSTLLYAPEMWYRACGTCCEVDCRSSTGAGRACRAAWCPARCRRRSRTGGGVEVDCGPPCCACWCDTGGEGADSTA
jgi:hypothetical protein